MNGSYDMQLRWVKGVLKYTLSQAEDATFIVHFLVNAS